MSSITILVSVGLSLLGLVVALFYMRKVSAVPVDMGLETDDAERTRFIHGAIADGAMAFLKQEYKFLTIFMLVFGLIIAVAIDDAHTPQYHEGIYTMVAFFVWRFDIGCIRIYWNESRHARKCEDHCIGKTKLSCRV